MFAKDAENEGESEDEEWGLHVRKKSRKKASEDGCMVVNSIRDANKVLNDDVPTHTSKYSRIPASAVKVYNTFLFLFLFVCFRVVYYVLYVTGFLVVLPHMNSFSLGFRYSYCTELELQVYICWPYLIAL
jgi:hypothetical protein